MAAPSIYNFALTRGADFAYGFRLKINCSYQDISDWIFASEIRNADQELVGQFETEILPDGITLRVFLSGTATRAITENIVYSDLFARTPDGRIICFLVNKITVRGSVTAVIPTP
jgi:hypothetical protein